MSLLVLLQAYSGGFTYQPFGVKNSEAVTKCLLSTIAC